jgi:hypothetical protein
MKANRAFALLVSRDGREPAFLADPKRQDRLEVVSVDSGEVVFYWQLAARAAAKLERRLRADLAALEATEFVEVWSREEPSGGDPR